MSTIDTTISHGIYLGPSPYPSPLTITSIGEVEATSANAAHDSSAIYGVGTGLTLVNEGTVIGETGVTGIFMPQDGSIDNSGFISGYLSAIAFNSGPDTITNSGTIESTGDANNLLGFRYGVGFGGEIGYSSANNGSTLFNNGGDISGGIGFLDGTGTVDNSGSITDDKGNGITLFFGGTVTDSGAISGSGGSYFSIYFGSGFFTSPAQQNLVDLEAGYSLGGKVDGSTVAGSTNTLELTGSSAAPVTVNFTPTQFEHFNDVEFAPDDAPNYGKLEIATSADQPATITGFTGHHDTIDLGFVHDENSDATAVLNGDLLTVTGDDSTFAILQLDPADDYSGLNFVTAQDGDGTDVTPACFCAGTLVLTDRGEVPVEELRIGDRLMTSAGAARVLKWIGRRSYAGRLAAGNPKVQPVCVKQSALADGVPRRDLWLSQEHALYVEGQLVPAGLLVNGRSICVAEAFEEIHYFHLELETHDVILAEGTPAESFIDDDSRGIFHNAAEFHRLYPTATRELARYCAPRVEEGVVLEALRRRLEGRARRMGADGRIAPAPLQGKLDLVRHDRLEGWARDSATPDRPVALVVLVNGAEIARIVADRYRADLHAAGLGEGNHAFELVLPGGLAADMPQEIEICRATDWAPLPGSPAVLAPLGGERQLPAREIWRALALPGTLSGNLDSVSRSRIAGWAQDGADGERPVGLVVKVNGRTLARILANRERADLATAGIGNGRHAFELVLPKPLSALVSQEISVLRETDGVELPGSPRLLPAGTGLDDAVEEALGDMFAGIGQAEEERALAFLARETEGLLERRAERQGRTTEREALRLFRRRWGAEVEATAEGRSSAFAARRALVVDLQVPAGARDAGSVAILSHMRALRVLGYEASFVASEEMRAEAALARLAEDEGIVACGAPHYTSVEDVLSRQAGSFDLVYLHRAATAERYLPLVRRYAPRAQIVYGVADLHHLRFARQAQVERRLELLAYSRQLAEIETFAARRADFVVTHSPVEAEMLRRVTGFGKVHVVPFAVAARPSRKPFAERQGIAIVGGVAHAPNADAVHHLIRDILPLVWRREPTLTCKIVGKGWHAGLLPGLDPRIELLGAVENLDALFDTIRLTVAPLRFGAGIKGKVLDSFAARLPCVMSPVAAEGLPLTGSLTELVTAEPAIFAEQILRLHADQAANERLGEEGARLVAKEFSAERVVAAFRKMLEPTKATAITAEKA
jgi:glycosyltransferase involved in cell wall biosynthesis